MKIVVLLCALGLGTSVFGALPFATDRTNQKTVDAICIYRDDVSPNRYEMHAVIDFNGNDVDRIIALPGPRFERNSDETTNEQFCTVQGALSSGSVKIEASVFDNSVQGPNPCGAQRVMGGVNQNTVIGYEWYIQARERYNDKVYTDIDRTYRIQCLRTDTLNNYVMASTQVYPSTDLDGTANPVRPVSRLSVVSDSNLVKVREYVELRVETDQVPNRNQFQPYGSYVYHCHNRFSVTGSTPTLFIHDNGCPVNGNRFSLVDGFKHTSNMYTMPVTGLRTFVTQTDSFMMAAIQPPGNTFYITCYVQYCTGPEESDARCTDYCSYNSRKKRSVLADADRVTLTVRIYNTNGTDASGSAGDQDDSGDTTLIAIAATVGAIFFVLAIVGCCFLCFAFRRRARADDDRSSTDDSTSNLPRHLKEDHIRPVKF